MAASSCKAPVSPLLVNSTHYLSQGDLLVTTDKSWQRCRRTRQNLSPPQDTALTSHCSAPTPNEQAALWTSLEPPNLGGRDKPASAGGLGLHLLILPPRLCSAAKCKEFTGRWTSNRHVCTTHNFPLHFIQSCPFSEFKIILKKTPNTPRLAQNQWFPHTGGETFRDGTAKQSTLWAGTHQTRKHSPPIPPVCTELN